MKYIPTASQISIFFANFSFQQLGSKSIFYTLLCFYVKTIFRLNLMLDINIKGIFFNTKKTNSFRKMLRMAIFLFFVAINLQSSVENQNYIFNQNQCVQSYSHGLYTHSASRKIPFNEAFKLPH